MEKHAQMLSFTVAANEFLKSPNERATSLIQRNLSVISKTIDMSIFDPDSSIATEFYTSLFSLLQKTNCNFSYVGSALDVLQTACKNAAAKRALTHNYKFPQILVNLLKTYTTDQTSPQRQEQILMILQDLTCGIQILWQEAHLSFLISTLAQWVLESTNEKLICLSLGILTNVCYKNLPAIYIFVGSVDSKKFTRHMSTFDSTYIDTRVQCVKFLLTLDVLSREISDKTIECYIELILDSIIKALINRDITSLKHAIEFFENFKDDARCREILLLNCSYCTHVQKMIACLENTSSTECVPLVIKFLLTLLKYELADLSPMHSKLIQMTMKYIPLPDVSINALELLKYILMKENASESKKDSTLSQNSDILKDVNVDDLLYATALDESMMDKKKYQIEGFVKKCSEFLQVIHELMKNRKMRDQIVTNFNLKSIQNILLLVLNNKEDTTNEKLKDNINDSFSSMFVHALSFISDIAPHQSSWAEFYNQLLELKNAHLILAHAIFVGDEIVKAKIFQLMTDDKFCTSEIITCMKELEKILLMQGAVNGAMKNLPKPVDVFNLSSEIYLNCREKEDIDDLLAKVKDACQSGQVAEHTSSIMELYEFKLSSMLHNQTALEKSLEASNNHNAILHHNLMQMNIASDRLRAMLFNSQQCLEVGTKEKLHLQKKMENMQADINKMHAQYKEQFDRRLQYEQQLESERKQHLQQIAEKDNTIAEMEVKMKKFADVMQTIAQVLPK